MRPLAASLAALVVVGATAPGQAQLSDLEGVNTTVISLQGSVPVTNSGSSPTCCNATLTNVGPSSTYTGVMSDGAFTTALTQNSTVGGTLTLTGTNTYSGPTTVQAGTLAAGAANAFSAASATSVLGGGTLDLGGFNQTVSSLAGGGTVTNTAANNNPTLTNVGASSTFSGVIEDGGTTAGISLTQDSTVGGTLTLTGANTYSGATIVLAGTLRGGAANVFSANSLTFVEGGTLDLGGFAQTINHGTLNLSGGVIQNGQLNRFISWTGGTINGLGGAAFVNLTGAATLTRGGSNSYTGGTSVAPFNTLKAGAAGAFSPNSAMTLVDNATLDLNGFDQTVSSLQSVVNFHSLPIVTNSGASEAILTNQGASSTFSGVIQDGASKIGLTENSIGNTLTLSGPNTYSGPTTVQAGTLAAGALDAFSRGSAVTIDSGGTLDLGGFDQTIENLAGAGHVTSTGRAATLNVNETTGAGSNYSGAITGAVSLTVNGSTLTLSSSGGNTYSGTTTIESSATLKGGATNAFSANSATGVQTAGTLDLGGFNQTVSSLSDGGVSPGGTVTNSGAADAVLTNQGVSSTFSGVIQDGAHKTGLTQNSAGHTLTLSGANTYSGPTTVQAGTLAGGALNAFSPSSATSALAGGTLDLGGLAQTIDTVNLAGGVIQNGALTSVNGITSTGGTVDGIGGTAGLNVASGLTTLNTATGPNTYSAPTNVFGGTLKGGAANAFSPNSAVAIGAGGALDLGGPTVTQTIDTVNLAGGVIQDGVLNSPVGITSTGGVVDGIGGTTDLIVNGGVTTLKTATGANAYIGPTIVNPGGTLIGGATNAFSAASPLAIAGGTVDLGGFHQTINSVFLSSGVIRNGTLESVNGIVGSGGTIDTMTVFTSGRNGNALSVADAGSRVQLVGTNAFTTQGDGAVGLQAAVGGAIAAAGATNVATSGGGAHGINADGLVPRSRSARRSPRRAVPAPTVSSPVTS
jgi:autotransporter-associated beta strand protein